MADDSLEIITPMECHPCDTPRGCTYYKMAVISDCQQLKLNELKLATIKSDEKYLHRHPEIRGFVALITRYVFKQQPRRNIPLLIKEFFNRPSFIIEDELEAYLRTRPPVEPEGEGAEEEEEIYYQEDYNKYLASLKRPVEEIPYAHPKPARATEITSEEFIRQLLLDRVRQFPSLHGESSDQAVPDDLFEMTDDTLFEIHTTESNMSDAQRMSPTSILRDNTRSLVDVMSMSGDGELDVEELSKKITDSRTKKTSSMKVRMSEGSKIHGLDDEQTSKN